MSLTNSGVVTLRYGQAGCFSCEIDARRVAVSHPAPPADPDFRNRLRHVLRHPLDFPPLSQAVIADDRVVLALDRQTPQAPAIVAELWSVLALRGVDPRNVLVIQPDALTRNGLADPRAELPDDVRSGVAWKVHDSTDRAACAYLATTAGGERVYLARDVIDADVLVSVGFVAYDPVLGYRGTGSVFYPGLSTHDALLRSLGQGHSELRPEDSRPVRQIVDEVAWLLGTQFSIQVVPAASHGVAGVVAGLGDSVYLAARRLLDQLWRVRLEERTEVVVVAVDDDAAGHGWEQIGSALATATQLVRRGGKIVVLSEVAAEPGAGLELVRASASPGDAIRPLRAEMPPDLLPATQLASAVDWARVYLLSRLDSEVVEDLFLVPLEGEQEVARLLAGEEQCAFIGSAQSSFGEVGTPECS